MRTETNILIVDDEIKIMEVVKSFLETKGCTVFCAENAQKAFQIFNDEKISLILLDLMLPDLPGETICKEIRKESHVPIIMLTAKVKEEEMLRGLGLGADDYITKPFSLKTLYARIEAVLRRTNSDFASMKKNSTWDDGTLEINFESHTVKKHGKVVNLTPNEFNILVALVKNPNKVLTRDIIIDIAFHDTFDGYSRAIDNYIKNLRYKIENDPKNPVYIQTVHGVGYKLGG